MKKDRFLLLALMVMVLPLGFLSCSDDDDDKPGPVDPEVPAKTAIAFGIPDFSASYVYLVTDGDKKLAEICNEYIPAFSGDKRATVVYPFDKNGKIDHTKGIVADNGGSVSWAGAACTYKAGALTAALKTLYVDSNLILTAGEPMKTVEAAPDKLKDGDNNEYKIVKIGNQYWIGENYKATKNKNGGAITTGLSVADWCNNTTEAYTVYAVDPPGEGEEPLSDDLSTPEKIKANYGLIYNWAAAKAVAPAGWHLPAAAEWETLKMYLGDTEDTEVPKAGGMLKEEGLNHWNNATGWDDNDNEIDLGNVGATNVTGFTAVGSGFVYMVFPDMEKLPYGSIKKETYWWTVTEGEGGIIVYGPKNRLAGLEIDEWIDPAGSSAFSVRLIRD